MARSRRVQGVVRGAPYGRDIMDERSTRAITEPDTSYSDLSRHERARYLDGAAVDLVDMLGVGSDGRLDEILDALDRVLAEPAGDDGRPDRSVDGSARPTTTTNDLADARAHLESPRNGDLAAILAARRHSVVREAVAPMVLVAFALVVILLWLG